MIIYNPLTTRMTITQNQVGCLNMWKRRGGGYCVQRYNGGVPRDDWEAGHAAMCVKSCRKARKFSTGKKIVDLRAGIAQRVGTGLRPGKLRKKALGEDNKDNELTGGIDAVRRIRRAVQFSVEGSASNPRGLLATPGIRRG